MKSMTDYFGRSPKGDEPVTSSKEIKALINASPTEPTQKEISSTSRNNPSVTSHCNSQLKCIRKDIDSILHSGSKSTSKKNNFVSSKFKTNIKETSDTEVTSSSTEDKKCVDTHTSDIHIKLKRKKSESCEKETLREDVLPQALNDECDSSTANKTIKSPQGTMLRYLVSQPKSSPEDKSNDFAIKPKKDLKNILSSPSQTDSDLHKIKSAFCHKLLETEAQIPSEKFHTAHELSRKTIKKDGPGSKRKKISNLNSKKNTSEDVLVDSSKSSKTETVKNVSKSSRRKLSLSRSSSNVSEENSSLCPPNQPENINKEAKVSSTQIDLNLCSETLTRGDALSPKCIIASSMARNLKHILNKSPVLKCQSLDQSSQNNPVPQVSKKRKLNISEHCNSSEENDSFDNHDLLSTSLQHEKVKKSKHVSEESMKGLEPSNKQEDNGSKEEGVQTNNLMKYFSRMSKEDALLKSEKVEVKVKVMVHSPPTTPSKKKKKRSIRSLPGGSAGSLKKKDQSLKKGQKDDVDAIDLIGVEEIKFSDAECETQLPLGTLTSASPSSISEIKTPGSLKSYKKRTCRKNSVIPISPPNSMNSPVTSVSPDTTQNQSSSFCTSSPHVQTEVSAQKLLDCRSPPSSIRSWQMRVFLNPSSLPSSRGTLHEEESENDEICHNNKKKKKRKVSCKRSASALSKKNVHDSATVVQDDSSYAICVKEGTSNKEDVKIAPLFNRSAQNEAKEEDEVVEVSVGLNRKVKARKNLKNSNTKQLKENIKNKAENVSSSSVQKSVHPEKAIKLAPLFNKKVISETEEESDCEEIFIRKIKVNKFSGDKKVGASESVKRSDDLGILHTSHSKPSKSSPEVIFEKEMFSRKEDAKVAPLFNLKARNDARQQFLQSGMPEQMRRLREEQRSFEDQDCDLFPKDSHIQQKEDNEVWNLSVIELPLLPEDLEPPHSVMKLSMGDLTSCVSVNETLEEIISTSCEGPRMLTSSDLPFTITKSLLRRIRNDAPTFKVAKTYKALQRKFLDEKKSKATSILSVASSRPKRKAGCSRKSTQNAHANSVMPPHSQVWTEKYKPITSSEIVGNAESVRKLSKWLEAWRKVEEDITKHNHRDGVKKLKRRRKEDDSDDFVVSDYSSDEDSRNLPDSTAVLYGPTGSGKTCTVYAVARDLGFKVLEVNASEKRNGKIVLAKLSEATQSHQVQRSSSAEQSFNALFSINSKPPQKRKTEGKSIHQPNKNSEEDASKKMSLILFEDVDIMFEEEDEGFLAAISNLISTSKRPVILTATDFGSSYLSRFLSSSCIILEFSPVIDLISTWLQIVSLLEGIYVSTSAISALVTLYEGDLRRSLLQMQLWVVSGGNNLPMASLQSIDFVRSKKGSKKNIEEDAIDDDISLSLDEGDNLGNAESPVPINTDCLGAVLGRNDIAYPQEFSKAAESFHFPSIEIPFPLDLGLYWWNIPRILCLKQITHSPLPVPKQSYNSGKTRLLDDSFIENFCSEDESCTDSVTNENFCSVPEQDVQTTELIDNRLKNSCSQNALLNVDPNTNQLDSNKNGCSIEELRAVVRLFNCVSSIDVFSSQCNLPEARINVEPISRTCVTMDGLSLIKVDVEGPNCTIESTARELCHWLGEKCLLETRSRISPINNTSDFTQCDYNPCLPSREEKKWRAAHMNTEDLLLAAIPYYMHLEHRAISMDYLPALRIFCRQEQMRSIMNTKRRNRFYHYLRSLGANLSDGQLELLCQTMSANMMDK